MQLSAVAALLGDDARALDLYGCGNHLCRNETPAHLRFIPEREELALPSDFEQRVLALLPRLRRFAAGLTHSVEDGDDLCLMTIERALRTRDQWIESTRLDAWIFRIMHNLRLHEAKMRGQRQQSSAGISLAVDTSGTGGSDSRVETGNPVDRAMAQLPDEQREAVLLVLVEGYTYREAANIVGCPIGTLTSRLFMGRTTLRRLLGTRP